MQYITVLGTEVTALGFGTANMKNHEEGRQAVSAALAAGYRHIDTAQIYCRSSLYTTIFASYLGVFHERSEWNGLSERALTAKW
jgi:aryl-alcohol dehydrogenase-like predicted oxidoreductase